MTDTASTATSDAVRRHPESRTKEGLWPYAVMGIALGIVFTRGEVISWFRIQEMFRFQSFHMYGVIGSAVVVGALSIQIIERFDMRSLTNDPICIPTNRFEAPGWQYWIGGTVFGLGWGLLGACPGPIYVLFGHGVTVMAAAFLSALVGVWVYAAVRHRLPHS
jgi:uncharacterized protein